MNGVFDNLDHVIEQCFDENGNIHVRISQDVVVLTQEESNRVIARFDQLKSENAKMRELVRDMMWTIRHAHGYFKNDTHEMLMTYVRGHDGKPTHVAHSLTCDEEMYEKRMRELGIEAV